MFIYMIKELLNKSLSIGDICKGCTISAVTPVVGIFMGGRRSPAVACWASDHWVASSNPLRGNFRH